jgi:tetratricopeptide (TPR) repeat protein
MLKDRRLIPKWRPFVQTLATPEASNLAPTFANLNNGNKVQLQRDIDDWRKYRGVGFLGAVLAHSMHSALSEEVFAVASEALASNSPITPIQHKAISKMLGHVDQTSDLIGQSTFSELNPSPQKLGVRQIRAILRESNDNPLVWLDLAQFQSAAGKEHSAERSIQVALQLAPHNRTVLRTAARFFVHVGQAVRGHRLISSHPRTASDPWLMASEIALADLAQKESRFMKLGSRIVEDGVQFSPMHMSELSGAVAVQQLQEGRLKKARKSQMMALRKPNDNVIAQALFLKTEFGVALDGPGLDLAIKNSNEALLLQYWSSGEAYGAEVQARLWYEQEPFSSRPVQLLTLLNIYKADYEAAHRWLKLGLTSDPNADELIINMAYLKVRLGKLDEAQQLLIKARRLSKKNEPFCKATEGFISFVQKNFTNGDLLYKEAMEEFSKSSNLQMMAYCGLFMALHATECDHPLANEHIALATDLIKKYPSADTNIFLKSRSADNLFYPVDIADGDLRSLQQLIYDERTNVLTIKHGVQSRNTPKLIKK